MVLPRPFRDALAAALAGVVVVAVLPTGARAATAEQRRALAGYLAAHPGGEVINSNEISYGGGKMIVTLRPSPIRPMGVADCPAGWFCFYEWPNYGYPRGRLSDCGRQNLADWQWHFRTESAHHNMGSGKVRFLYHGERLFEIGPGNRVRSDAVPYRNWANYVERVC